MGLNIFGSGSKGGGGAEGLMGAGAGFLGGGIPGAVLGGLGGLFGGGEDASSSKEYQYSQLSKLMAGARDSAAGGVGRLSERLGSGYYEDLIAQLQGEFSKIATTNTNEAFSNQAASQKSLAARSGGGLGSTQQYFDRARERDRSRALMEAIMGGNMAAESIVAGRRAGDVAGIQAGTGAIAGIEGTRRLTGETGTSSEGGSMMSDILGMGMGALSNPLSNYNSKGFSLGGRKFGGGYEDLLKNLLGEG